MSLKLYCALSYCKRLSHCVLNCAILPARRNKRYIYSSKQFYTCVTNFIPKDVTSEEEKLEEKPRVPKVTLLGPDNTIVTVAPLAEVKTIAESRDLRLVKIIDTDTRTQRHIYKMMTEGQYLEEEIKIKRQKKANKAKHDIKGEKLVLFSKRISDNDLEQRVKKVIRWLSKKFEVRVIVSCPDEDKSSGERVCTIIENAVSGGLGTVVQKRHKEVDIRFSILPPKVISATENQENKENREQAE